MARKAVFPKSLREFGYDFDTGGRLRKIDPVTELTSDEGFEFNVSEDPSYNQKRYEALGEIINEHVYKLLENEGLHRISVPKDAVASSEPRSFAFASEDAFSNEKLLILVHGSGVVRAGQWARRLIINDCLDFGTQIPYVRKARNLGYAVLILNTNDNERTTNDNQTRKIKGSEDPYRHMKTVWSDYVKPSKAVRIAIVAHSYGGVCVVQFALSNPDEFTEKVFAVALTDSVHAQVIPAKGTDHLIRVSKNWVFSKQPLDTPERTMSGDIECVSAGTEIHEMTSWSSIESVFKFLEERYRSVVAKKEL